MKKVLLFTALAAALSAGIAQAAEKLVVAATPVPHAEILELIKPTLAKEGVDLEIKVFTDYVQPNVQVDQKRLDANYFQTEPYLTAYNAGRGTGSQAHKHSGDQEDVVHPDSIRRGIGPAARGLRDGCRDGGHQGGRGRGL